MTERWGRNESRRVVLGLLLVVAAVAAVVVAFNSTNGLPFQDPYRLTVRVPDAAQLTSGSDVTIDGGRIGQVDSVTAVPVGEDGAAAEVEIRIDDAAAPLPSDSTFTVEQSAAVSRKQLAIDVGSSTRDLPDGATVDVEPGAHGPVDFDEFLNSFDTPARNGWRASIEAFGVGFAGRGETLNRALGETPPFLRALDGSMSAIGARRSELGRFVSASAALMSELQPVAPVLPDLVVGLDRTFTALAGVARPYLQEMISETPGSLERTGSGLERSRPMFQAARKLFVDFSPAADELPSAAPAVADMLESGTESLPLVPSIDRRMTTSLRRLAEFADATPTIPGVRRLTLTAASLRAPLRTIGPAETTCSYLSLLTRNLSSSMQETHATGSSIRSGGVVIGVDRDAERGPSSHVYEALPTKALGPVHSNPYPNTAAPGETRECEAGNEPYITNRAVIGNVPGKQELETEETSNP